MTRLERIVRAEEDELHRRVERRVRPVLVAAFKKAQAREPRLKRVIFGNGTCLVVWGGERQLVDAWRQHMPRALHRLRDLCCELCSLGYTTEDIE